MSLEAQEGEQGSSFVLPEKYHELTTSRAITAEDVATMDRLRANGDPVLNQALKELADRFLLRYGGHTTLIPNSDIVVTRVTEPYGVSFAIDPSIAAAYKVLQAQHETVAQWYTPIEIPAPTAFSVIHKALGNVAVFVSPHIRLQRQQDAELTARYAATIDQLLPTDSEDQPDLENAIHLPMVRDGSFHFPDSRQGHYLNRPFGSADKAPYPPATSEGLWAALPGAGFGLNEVNPRITFYELLGYDLLLADNPTEVWNERVREDIAFFSSSLRQLEDIENRDQGMKDVMDPQEWAESEAHANRLRGAIQTHAQQIVDRLCTKIITDDIQTDLRNLHESASGSSIAQRIISVVDSGIQPLLFHGYNGAVASEGLVGGLYRPIKLLIGLQYPRDNDDVERKTYQIICNEYAKTRNGLTTDAKSIPDLPTFDAIFHPLSYEHAEILRNPDDLQ